MAVSFPRSRLREQLREYGRVEGSEQTIEAVVEELSEEVLEDIAVGCSGLACMQAMYDSKTVLSRRGLALLLGRRKAGQRKYCTNAVGSAGAGR